MWIRVILGVGCATLLACSPAREALGGELKIELLPASRQVQVGDPLFIKVAVTNNSPATVKLPDRIATGSDTLHFDVRGPGEGEYRRLISTTPVGLRTPFRWDANLLPRATVVSCEAVFKADADRFAFSIPGIYFLRAQVGASEEAIGYSSTVEITVAARQDKGGAIEAPSSSLISRGLQGAGGSLTSASKAYESEAAILEASHLKTTLLWMAAIARIRDAKERDEQRRARAAFDSLRTKADTVTRDRMTLTLTEVLIRQKAYQAAILELDEIKDNNTQKARWLDRIRERQQEEEAAKSRHKTPPK